MSQALATHFAHDALLPRAPGGTGVGALLALLAHAALVWALTSTVQWRTRPPEVVSADLWAAVPQAAAPLAAPPPPRPAVPTPQPEVAVKPTPAPAPTPPPAAQTRDAEIATEQARRLELQRKALQEKEAQELKAQAAAEKAKQEAEKTKVKAKAEAERKALEAERAKTKAEAQSKLKQEAEDKRKADAEAKAEAKAEDDRLAKQREENLRRIMGQAGAGSPATAGTGGTGTAAQSAAPSASYVGRLIGMIKPNIVFTGQIEGNPSAEVEVRAAAGGSIMSKRLVKSSGNNDWDEAVMRALDRTATLPSDNGRVPPALILVFRPKD